MSARLFVSLGLLLTACSQPDILGVFNDAASPTTLPTSTIATPVTASSTSSTTTSSTTTSTTLPPGYEADRVSAATVGRPWGSVAGILQFRGNPSRTWYGTGLPAGRPELLWRYPEGPMCGPSTVGGRTTEWCGTGWTGQPAVWERPDGVTEVVFGTYDHAVHFVDAATGSPTRPGFPTGDIIKGSVTLDPDGYPLLYFGSRDDKLRIVALDRAEPVELWSLDGNEFGGIWNDDWDGNPAIVDDVLYEGGENGILFAVRLHRDYGPDGLATVSPEVLAALPTWDEPLLRAIGDRNVSVESSVAILEDRLYAANSGGRVLGVDLRSVAGGELPVVFDFWMGDDVDATPVLDAEGALYVAAELERFLPRAREVGQLVKLDPSRPDDPLVWSVPAPPAAEGEPGGFWATPALGDGVLYAVAHSGDLLAVDATTGEVGWSDDLGWHAWSSPVVADGSLLVADCSGRLRAYDLTDPRRPQPRWEVRLESGGCIESTPAVWGGRVFVGSRDGFLYAFGE